MAPRRTCNVFRSRPALLVAGDSVLAKRHQAAMVHRLISFPGHLTVRWAVCLPCILRPRCVHVISRRALAFQSDAVARPGVRRRADVDLCDICLSDSGGAHYYQIAVSLGIRDGCGGEKLVKESIPSANYPSTEREKAMQIFRAGMFVTCLLYTSPSPRDGLLSRMPSSA